MNILGHTPDGDLIIQISQAEWGELQNGIKPKEDYWHRRYILWPNTEIGILFLENKGTRGLMAIRSAYLNGEIDGTLKGLDEWLDSHIIRNFSASSRRQLKDLISEKLR